MMAAYMENTKAKVIHARRPVEECNSDDMAARTRVELTDDEFLDRIRDGWRVCQHCLPSPTEGGHV